MSNNGLQFLRPYISELVKAQAIFSEAKARGCSTSVLKVLDENFLKAKAALDRAMGEAK